MGKITKVLFILAGFALAFQPLHLHAQKSPEELAKETEAACAASAKTKPTIDMIKEKVDKAGALLAKEGKAAFSKFLEI